MACCSAAAACGPSSSLCTMTGSAGKVSATACPLPSFCRRTGMRSSALGMASTTITVMSSLLLVFALRAHCTCTPTERQLTRACVRRADDDFAASPAYMRQLNYAVLLVRV